MNARVVSLFMNQNVLVSLTIPSGDNKALGFFFPHYIVVSWIANWRSTQRRTDNLHEHKMTWLTYVKMIICTLLNVTVTLSNHSSELFSDFHTWHSWNIYIIQNVQHVQHFNNTLGILCDTMNEAAAVSLHFIYATCVQLDSCTFEKHEQH